MNLSICFIHTLIHLLNALKLCLSFRVCLLMEIFVLKHHNILVYYDALLMHFHLELTILVTAAISPPPLKIGC